MGGKNWGGGERDRYSWGNQSPKIEAGVRGQRGEVMIDVGAISALLL